MHRHVSGLQGGINVMDILRILMVEYSVLECLGRRIINKKVLI